MRFAAAWLLLSTLLLSVRGVSAAADASPASLRLQTRVSEVSNLVHWVDNLAGTSVGKTMPLYRRYWKQRFGVPDAGDREALDAFVRIRRLRIGGGGKLGNRSGCLPIVETELSWHQVFLAEAMQADSLQDFLRRLKPYLEAEDRAALEAALRRFQGRFGAVWRDLSHVRRFETRFREFLDDGKLLGYLNSLAAFLDVDPAGLPPMQLSFMALPSEGPTHAEADGDQLLIEIRPSDRPQQQIQVVAHEAVHFLMRRMRPEQLDLLADQAFRHGEMGLVLWSYLWEGIPTALGQGLAEATLARRSFSLRRSWYHRDAIDRFAKTVYPVLRDAIAAGRRLRDGVLPEAVAALAASGKFREFPMADALNVAVFVAGSGLEPLRDQLRRQLGTRARGLSLPFTLDDPVARTWMERYSCLPAVVLALGEQLPAVQAFLQSAGITKEKLDVVRQAAIPGGRLAVLPRPGGGYVFLLVAPDHASALALMETFTLQRGLPD